MSGLLGDNPLGGLLSWANGVKRKVSNPIETVLLGLTRAGEDFQQAGRDMDVAYGRNGMKSVLVTPEEKARAAQRAADFAAQHGMAAATVWHGSPHKFDKFDSSKIGTGEGAQAYGHGLYFAESPGVAGNYRNVLSDTLEVNGAAQPLEKRAAQMALTFGGNTKEGALQWLSKFEGKGANHVSPAMTPELVQQVKQKFSDGTFSQGGALYKVDLPDNAIAKMLDWDKPLSQQAPEVIEALNKKAAELRGLNVTAELGSGPRVKSNLSASDFYNRLAGNADPLDAIGPNAGKLKVMMSATGQPGVIADNVTGQALASKRLREMGIPGIRYLDGGSRGAGQGTSNYVVFPGGEDLLTILERNGVPVK